MSSRSKKKAAQSGREEVASSETKPNSSPRRRWLKRTVWILVGVLLFAVIADVAVAVLSIHSWTHPEKTGWSQSPTEVGIWSETFELETENGTVYGWIMAAQQPLDPEAEEWSEPAGYSEKTVVFAPNYDSNRELADLGGVDLFAEFCAAGYNVVTFDWTGSGYSDGDKNVFTLDKTAELQAVVEYAKRETGASFLALQGVGFSCYPAAVVTADCEAVNALILDSCYNRFSDVFFDQFGTWSAFDIAPVKGTVRWLFPLVSGVDVEDAELAEPIGRMQGKHLFFIQGEMDELFGSSHVQSLSSLAARDGRNQSSVWMVAEIGHLRVRSYDAETYFNKISQVLDKASGTEESAS